ncbi:MAG TPA: hypothetical protein VKR78_07725 [Acidimicrobiales bacterium]|nr:hypothetical protein [Acidimicrobiales bacterium]
MPCAVPGVAGVVVAVVVVDDVGTVVVVVVVVVVVEVVVVVDDVVVVVVVVVDVGGVEVRKFPADVPPGLSDAPIKEDSGLPAATSITVTRPSASTKVAATVTTTTQRGLRRRAALGGVAEVRPDRLHATSLVSPTSCAVWVAPPSPPSAGSSGAAGETCVSSSSPGPASTVASIELPAAASTTPPAAPVAPRRSIGSWWAFFTTTSRTFVWVRSIDSHTRAVTVVATTLPTATPITVPSTPKVDAMSAEMMAPAADAATCIGLSLFIGSQSRARLCQAGGRQRRRRCRGREQVLGASGR